MHARQSPSASPYVTLPTGLPFPSPPRLGVAAQGLGGSGATLSPVQMPPDAYVFLLQDTIMRLREAEAAMARQKERIEHLEALTMTDELTGLLNRRGFLEAFRRELAATRRGASGGVLLFIDLDGFKTINDVHGHLCGDAYLRRSADILRGNVREHDIAARLGGDEFALLLTRTGKSQGEARARRLEEIFHAATCPWDGASLPLRASFGAQAYGAEDDVTEALDRADALMYAAKRRDGKNRVVAL
jgi:diguanylate cyclase (GGDEF)-like protein